MSSKIVKYKRVPSPYDEFKSMLLGNDSEKSGFDKVADIYDEIPSYIRAIQNFDPTSIGSVHNKWSFHGRPRDSFYVEFHFEKASKVENLELFSHAESKIPQLEEALGERVTIEKD